MAVCRGMDQRRVPAWALPPLGLIGGAVWGTVARLWMRWVSTDPEFSWSGTLFIIGGFTVFGTGQGLAAAARHAGWRRPARTVARAVAGIVTLPLFMAAGGIMMPTVVFGGLAVSRTEWPRPVRVLVTLIALAPFAMVGGQLIGDFGASGGLIRVIALAPIYAVIVWAMRATMVAQADGWRMSPRVRVALTAVPVVLVALVILAAGGLS